MPFGTICYKIRACRTDSKASELRICLRERTPKMTYKEALKIKTYDKIQPKEKAENVTVISIEQNLMCRSVCFQCNDGNTYRHADVNQPILKIIENGRVTYSHDPNK